jgi:two-component system chemotaxis response regulator CheY
VAGSQPMISTTVAREKIRRISILVIDHNTYMRRVTRTMLVNLGAKMVHEAADGLAALEIIRNQDPDVVLLERDIPILSGPELLRIVRSPDLFPRPNLPVIMLTKDAQRVHIAEALRLGANEVLIKPTSPKALQDRLLSVLANPRPMVQIGEHYVPEPRAGAAAAL